MGRIHHPDQAARIVDSTLEGEAIGGKAVDRIAAGCSDPDLLMRTALQALAVDGFTAPAGPALRGAMRRVQKALEALHATV